MYVYRFKGWSKKLVLLKRKSIQNLQTYNSKKYIYADCKSTYMQIVNKIVIFFIIKLILRFKKKDFEKNKLFFKCLSKIKKLFKDERKLSGRFSIFG